LLSVSPSGSTLNFSATIPATDVSAAYLGLDAAQDICVAGALSNGGAVTSPLNPIQTGGNSFICAFTNSGSPIYATPVDGQVTGVAGAETGNAYITGGTGTAYSSVSPLSPLGAPSGTFISKISTQDAPSLAYEPSFLAFGSQLVGTTSSPMVLNFKNLGSATLDLTNIVVSGTGYECTLWPFFVCLYLEQ
jgi:hypothetical protein